MKKKTRILLPILVFVLAACSDNEDTASNLDPTQASEQLDGVAIDMSGDIITLTQSEGVEGISSLIDLSSNSTVLGRISPYQMDESKSYATREVSRIGHYFSFGVADVLQADQDLWDYTGVYEWNFQLEEFDLLEESDILIVSFPLEGSQSNDAEFRLNEISFVQIDGEEIPTVIKAELSVQEGQELKKVIDLDFSAEFASDDSLVKADISLDILPFSFLLSFDDSQSTSSSLNASLLLDGENITSVDIVVNFDSEVKLEPVSASGEVSYRTLSIVGSVSDEEMDSSVDSDPNDYIDLDLFIGGSKAGDIIFVLEEFEDEFGVYEDYVAYIQYADGTTEKLEDVLDPVFNEIDDLVDDLE